jgi:hypothetical protein
VTDQQKLDKVIEKLQDIDRTLIRNTISLEEHMRRTILLEQAIEPLKAHVLMVNGAMKVMAVLLTIAGVVASVLKIVLK